MTRVIACANLKGGEGKTTLARHIAYHAASKGLKTLAVDLDPQGNLTDSLLPDAQGYTSSAELFETEFSIRRAAARPLRQESVVAAG